MLKYSLAATTLLVVGLTACLDDPAGPDCSPQTSTITETRGDTVVTSTGLRYIETESGTSAVAGRWCYGAQVEYTGALLDGTQFDAGNFAFTPGVSNIIPGFAQGVVGMTVDSNRRLIIQPSLGYGAEPVVNQQTGAVIIPGNSTLIFDVELIAVQ
jgi:FKBP-type peptidyl-prolyl cis-trans isomerase